MLEVSDDQFADLIAQTIEELPRQHMKAVRNVAIVYADEPTPAQREQLRLGCNQTLYGLYEGVPLTKRGGQTGFPPDKITIFKGPLTRSVDSQTALRMVVKHTVWHEIAHYFGLDHDRIHQLEAGL